MNIDEEKITRMEDLLAADLSKDTKKIEVEELNTKQIKTVKSVPSVPRGKPKSGRIWKEQKTRFSSLVKSRGLRQSFEKKQKLREELKRVKEISRAVVTQRKADKEAKRQRRIENLKRAEENRKKSEIVQVIKNPAKIKRMKKKQLRMVEKRDTTNML